MNILQKTIGYIAAPISLIQLFRPVVLGITTIADISSNGKATKYLNNGQKNNLSRLYFCFCSVMEVLGPNIFLAQYTKIS